MTLDEWEDQNDRELDESLTALFRSVEPPAPRPGFASRAISAARRAPLPAGRVGLGRPWTVPLGWAALASGAAGTTYGIGVNQPVFAEAFASLLSIGVRAGLWLPQFVRTGSAVFDLLSTTGGVVARTASTKAGAAGLVLMTLVAAVSLSMLNRLLSTEKESSSW